MTYKTLLRFSLRSLFLSVTVFAVVLGIWLHRAKRQRQAVEWLGKIELCEIGYEFNERGHCPPKGMVYYETRLERTLGIDCIQCVVNVELPATRLEAAMPYLKKLPALKEVLIYAYEEQSEEEGAQQLHRAFRQIHESLPRVKASVAEGCPLLVVPIPLVG